MDSSQGQNLSFYSSKDKMNYVWMIRCGTIGGYDTKVYDSYERDRIVKKRIHIKRHTSKLYQYTFRDESLGPSVRQSNYSTTRLQRAKY